MYKRIIAGVLSAVICSSAITSNNVSQTSWGASANNSPSPKAENESTSYDVDSPDKSTNYTSDDVLPGKIFILTGILLESINIPY